VLALASGASAQGTWVGPAGMNWEGQLNPPPQCPIGQDYPELAHAALIPFGPARGMLLLWGNECSNALPTRLWVFDPKAPGLLVPVVTPVQSDIFCSGHSWSGSKLLIAGAYLTPADLRLSWQFDPSVLTFTSNPRTLVGNPWEGPFEMALAHYYPTVITLCKGNETANSGVVIPGGSSIVLGGPVTSSSSDGMVYWQFFSTAFAQPGWSHLFHPPNTVPTPFPVGFGSQEFKLVTTPPNSPPQLPLDSYPRAFQLGERTPETQTSASARNIFVSGDVDTGTIPANSPGHTVAIRPPSKAFNYPGEWELHGTKPAGSNPATNDNDRQYGTSVCLLLRGPQGQPMPNRVLNFGGFFENPNHVPPIPPTPSNTVQEFIPDTHVTNGQWIDKANMLTARAYTNAVVLPTRKVFLVGGAKELPANQPPVSVDKALFAELYDVGSQPGDFGSTQAVTPPNTGVWSSQHPNPPPTPPDYTYRLYHSFAALQPDGSVLVSGGHQKSYVNSEYTAEIYRPDYMARSRPVINARSLGTKTYLQQVSFDVEVFHENVERVVLTRPASVTHHCDYNQRLVELFFSAPSYESGSGDVVISVTASMPHETWAPPGWYLLWVIETDASGNLIPSEACWVELQ
jgi:hypothetical protein